MADYPGVVGTSYLTTDLYVNHPGKSTGLHVPPPATIRPDFNIEALAIPYAAGTYAFVDSSVTPPASVDRPGILEDASPAKDWFETVHIIPRDGIDFGNIITQVDQRFEIFNAHRRSTVSLLSITNNALPGTDLPDMPTPPADLRPLESFLDPLSTSLNPLGQIVRAFAEGLSTFNTTIDFVFDLGVGTIPLLVQGDRIALFVANFDGGLQETLEFFTDVLLKKSGKEQRISPRKNPRQIFQGRVLLTDETRQRIQAILFRWQDNIVALPVWPEQMEITSSITGGSTATAQVKTTNNTDIRIGALAAVLKDDLTFDVLEVDSITATSVTFTSNITNSYDEGDLVIPIRLCYITGPVRGVRMPVNVEYITPRFEVIDNNTGAPTGDTSGYNSYNSKVLLDDYNFISPSGMPEEFDQKVYRVDNETGVIWQDTAWDINKRIHHKGFVTKTKAELWKIRRLLYALRGQQISFYIPTFIEDLTVTQNLVISTDTMRITRIGYARFIDETEPKATFRITFTDGTSLVRTITASSQVSDTEEELTVDTVWPANRNVSEIVRVEFYEKVRINTDAIKIQHSSTVGHARIFFPVKTVFD